VLSVDVVMDMQALTVGVMTIIIIILAVTLGVLCSGLCALCAFVAQVRVFSPLCTTPLCVISSFSF
jgi:hypothetical protein